MTVDQKGRPFQTIREAANTTGFSQHFIRVGCKAGAIPHIKAGEKYLVNVSAFLELMDQRSRGSV